MEIEQKKIKPIRKFIILYCKISNNQVFKNKKIKKSIFFIISIQSYLNHSFMLAFFLNHSKKYLKNLICFINLDYLKFKLTRSKMIRPSYD